MGSEDYGESHQPDPPDTEITLGTGKMLVLFFALVVLCSVFFALGYKLGRGSGSGADSTSSPSAAASGNAAAKPTLKPGANSSDLATNRSAGPDGAPSQVNPPDSTSRPTDSGNAQAPPAPTEPGATPAPAGSYFVQVAAVTKQEDADALVDALKKKQYAAFSSTLADKFFHVQVGPFTDIKEAEATRARLVG